jgi:hypothetical protein
MLNIAPNKLNVDQFSYFMSWLMLHLGVRCAKYLLVFVRYSLAQRYQKDTSYRQLLPV